MAKFRYQVANRSDDRIKFMTELINGIQVVKMYTWEKYFENTLKTLRNYEVKAIKNSLIVKSIFQCLIVVMDRLSIFATIACYVLLGRYSSITADKIFFLMHFYTKMQLFLSIGFPIAINLGAEMLVTIKRLDEYLILEERQFMNLLHVTERKESFKVKKEYELSKKVINLENVYTCWNKNEWRLTKASINIPSGSLCVIVGPVGSGKSSLLNLILRELPVLSGQMEVSGKIAYASQQPWIFVDSIRNNILFGRPYIKYKYDEVARICALQKDFLQFSHGDLTFVGENGISLSGGQKARINLARAVYEDADIYLLDDPLSAVDTKVGKHLFDECIDQYLKKKTRVLVTHQLQYLHKADLIIVVDEVSLIKS